jgi:hypothetical protein
MLIGMALLIAGLYGKVGTAEDVWAEEDFRHGRANGDPQAHSVSAPNPSHDKAHVSKREWRRNAEQAEHPSGHTGTGGDSDHVGVTGSYE